MLSVKVKFLVLHSAFHFFVICYICSSFNKTQNPTFQQLHDLFCSEVILHCIVFIRYQDKSSWINIMVMS